MMTISLVPIDMCILFMPSGKYQPSLIPCPAFYNSPVPCEVADSCSHRLTALVYSFTATPVGGESDDTIPAPNAPFFLRI